MEMSLDQLLISLARKQLTIEFLELQLNELTNKYNNLLAQNDMAAGSLPFPFPDSEEMKKLKEG